MVDRLYFMKIIDEIPAAEVEKMLTVISTEKREQINKLKFEKDKKMKLYAEIIVRYLIRKALNVTNSWIQFRQNENGKPYLKDYSDFHFNLSHTKNAIVVGISAQPIGVDIENIKMDRIERDQINQIAKRFFMIDEFEYIIKYQEDQTKRFYEIWTKKEAYTKYLGVGLTLSLASFNVLSQDIDQQLLAFEKENYIISVCSEEKFMIKNIVELCEIDLIKMVLELRGQD